MRFCLTNDTQSRYDAGMKTIDRSLIKRIESHRNKIALERDGLRKIKELVDELLEPTERAVEALDEAINSISEVA